MESSSKRKRIVLVTGAAQGIGKAIAIKFLEQGESIILTDVKEEQLKKATKEISNLKGDSSYYILDVSKSAEVEKTVDLIINKMGRIDILINNAGMGVFGEIEDVTDELLDEVLKINFKGAFYLCRKVVPIMKKHSYGKIVNISSIVAKRGDNTTSPCYGSSKGALTVLTKSLARQLGPFGINVNGVAPHAIDTSIMKLWDEEKKREVAKSLPVRRIGKPEDVASAVLFLASDEASYITGQIINIDGGHFMDS